MPQRKKVKDEEPASYQHRADLSVTQAPANEIVPLQFNGVGIHERGEMLSLTDMWKAAGSPDNQSPAQWLRTPKAEGFSEAVAVNVGKSHNDIVKTVRGGRTPGTWGHWQLAISYARYLSHEFHIWTNTVVRDRMEQMGARQVVAENTELDVRTNGIVRSLKHDVKVMKDALAETQRAIIQTRQEFLTVMVESDPRRVAVGFRPALEVLQKHGIPAKGRRAFSQYCSNRLRRFSLANGYPMRESDETGRWMFHVDAISAWLEKEGLELFTRHKAKLAGDGELFRVVDGGKVAS